MKVASALVSGRQADPELAAAAVRQAMTKGDMERAACVVLLLGQAFARQPQTAVLAAARAAGCMQVAGGTAAGLLTEEGWQLDQPAAAVLVFDQCLPAAADAPIISLAGASALPHPWRHGARRAGLVGSEGAAWLGSRPSNSGQSEFTVPASRCRSVLSTGLRHLGAAQHVDTACAFELQGLAAGSALDSLRRALPGELREHPPLHQIAALRQGDEVASAILSINADGSLTMTDEFQPGDQLTWAIRQPLSAEEDMRAALNAAVDDAKRPDFALMFSCIGRGPLFYGDDDRDLLAFRQRFPGVPLLGAYGSGQIVPGQGENRLFHNSVLTLLFENPHV